MCVLILVCNSEPISYNLSPIHICIHFLNSLKAKTERQKQKSDGESVCFVRSGNWKPEILIGLATQVTFLVSSSFIHYLHIVCSFYLI